MEHLSLAGEVVIGSAIGYLIHRQKHILTRLDAITKHIAECPVVKKRKVPLESLFIAGLIGLLSLCSGCVKVQFQTPDGHSLTYSRFTLGSVAIGEMSITTNTARIKGYSTENATALEAVARGVAEGLNPIP